MESSFAVRLRSWFLQPDRLAFLGLLGLLFVFYPDLFLVKAAPLTGDHLEQHYPWAYLLAQSVKQFTLPFWTPLIHCGFPLVAESQVGAFYIPNLLMYFFLPFHVAYSYMNLVHWFIAGWGTYLYAKQMKLGAMPSFVAAIIFTFGAAYGGAYYNMTSLKTICWFPVVLYFFERYLEKRQWRFWVGMTALIGQSIVAGYLQMAVFTWLIFGVYVLLRIIIFSEKPFPWPERVLTLSLLMLGGAAALVLALPQLLLTYQLAMMSNRTGLEEGYAYVGSMSPLALGTLINPSLSDLLRGNNLYAGAFSLFFVLLAFASPEVRLSRSFRIWGVILLLAFLLALGQWSPLYVAIIKITKFYSFRVPAKFLGFFCFALAMLSAVGFQSLWMGRPARAALQKAFSVYLAIVAGFVALMIFGNVFFTAGKETAMKLGEYFVRHFVFGQPGHPHSLETYLAGVKNYPGRALQYLSFSVPSNLWAVATSVLCVIFVALFLRRKTVTRFLLIGGIIFLVADLYAASYADIRGDLAAYKAVLAFSPAVRLLEQEREAGRLGRIYGFRSPDQRLPLVPSQNMLYGIEDIGAYSPLVSQRYYQTIGLLGNVNDSTLAVTPTPGYVRFHLPLLSFLDVSHVLSTTPLVHPKFTPLFADPAGKVFLYRNEESHAAAYFIKDVKLCGGWDDLRSELMANDFDPAKQLLLEAAVAPKDSLKDSRINAGPLPDGTKISRISRSGAEEVWELTATASGFFVTPELFYPGWQAFLNGKPVSILPAYGLFRAVEIKMPGTYKLEFRYKPFGPIMAGVKRS